MIQTRYISEETKLLLREDIQMIASARQQEIPGLWRESSTEKSVSSYVGLFCLFFQNWYYLVDLPVGRKCIHTTLYTPKG